MRLGAFCLFQHAVPVCVDFPMGGDWGRNAPRRILSISTRFVLLLAAALGRVVMRLGAFCLFQQEGWSSKKVDESGRNAPRRILSISTDETWNLIVGCRKVSS